STPNGNNKRQVVTESNEELISLYKSFSEKIGATNGASMSELKKYGFKYSSTVFLRRFGNWKNVKELSGFTFKLGSIYSKENIVRTLLLARTEKGRRLSQREINENRELPCLETIFKFFKTTKISKVWDELEQNIEKTTAERKIYSLEEIKDLLYKQYCLKGSSLTTSEIESLTKQNILPGKSTIYRYFKTCKIKQIWKTILKEKLTHE
ncbi:MAG: homing endonuclease associated repeat-containing protein, partial [Cetobacterium sp.]